MDLVSMNMSGCEARKAVVEYAKALKHKQNAEYQAVLDGYKEILKGRRVIDLNATLTAAGVDRFNHPQLAIARADKKWGYFFFRSSRYQYYSTNDEDLSQWDLISRARGTRYKGCMISAAKSVLEGVNLWNKEDREWTVLRAMVPLIPPGFNPGHSVLNKYWILWDAEWKPLPPTDPALLKHIGGSLYSVVAQWNLTAIERAVLFDSRIS